MRRLALALAMILAVGLPPGAARAQDDEVLEPGDSVAAAMAAARRAAAKSIEEQRRQDSLGLFPEEPGTEEPDAADSLGDGDGAGRQGEQGSAAVESPVGHEEGSDPLERDPAMDGPAADSPRLPSAAAGAGRRDDEDDDEPMPGAAADDAATVEEGEALEPEESGAADDAVDRRRQQEEDEERPAPREDRFDRAEGESDWFGFGDRYDPTRDPVDLPDGDIRDGDVPDDDTPFSDAGAY